MEDFGGGRVTVNRMMYKSNNVVSENNRGGTVVFNGGNSQLGGENRSRQESAARRFLDRYYNILDGNHDDSLASLYHEDSVFTIDNETFLGSQNIVAKLTSLPFPQYRRSFTSFNCQPCGNNGGLLVFVCGNLQIAGGHDALKFSQVFHLMPTLQGSYYVMNDILSVNDA